MTLSARRVEALFRSSREARGVEVRDGVATELVVQDDRLVGVRLDAGAVVPCDALLVAPRLGLRDGLLASLGIRPVTDGVVAVDADGRTEVPGVHAAGNVVDPTVQVVGAAAGGSAAGIALNADLVQEDVGHAVEGHRATPRR